MKLMLPDLEPHFLKRMSRFRYKHTDDIAAAEGMIMLCPACYWSSNGNKDRTHAMIVWRPSPPRPWDFVGTGYSDLTLKAGLASVAIIGGCRSNFDIKRGKVDFC